MNTYSLEPSPSVKECFSILDPNGEPVEVILPVKGGNYELGKGRNKCFSSVEKAFEAYCNANRRHVKEYSEQITWKGQSYSVPCDPLLERMAVDCLCLTPDGREVEPDHPDSWLSLLELI